MSFFQNTVVDKYLNASNKQEIKAAYEKFKTHFHNPQIQQNIRNSKEEQYQEGFLRDLFVNILGYTLNPQNNFNLTTEYKNIKDILSIQESIKRNYSIQTNVKIIAENEDYVIVNFSRNQ